MDPFAFIPGLCIWLVALAYLLSQTWRQPSSGLVLAYCFQLWMLHWLAGLIYALPWSELPDPETELLGFQQSTYGVVAFTIGASLLGARWGKWIVARNGGRMGAADPGLPRAYVILGIVSYLALAPTLGTVPGFTAVSSVGSQFVVIGCCLACWQAGHKKGKTALLKTLLPTMAVPAITVVTQGFLGYGVTAISIIMMFCSQFFRPRWLLVLGFLAAGYGGLCFYTSYMRDRNAIRASVWGGESLTQRLQVTTQMVSNMDAFDVYNPEHLAFVNDRLNQNTLVGAAVTYLSQSNQYARGATIWDAVLALIPRVLWPSKPMTAGSGRLVTRFTGMTFAEGTSVGIGQALEFYANFGTMGVVVGFFLMGGIIKALDVSAGSFLATGNWRSFTTSFLVGISFLNVGGSLVEISMGAMGSLVVAAVVNKYLKTSKSSLAGKPLEPVGPVVG
jgi:hypothetical protein